jgi:hypothetical protein
MMNAHRFIAFAFLLVIGASSLASAYSFGSARSFTQDVIDAYVDFGEPVLQALFGGFGWSGLYLFERFLLFLLVLSLLYVILGNMELFKKNIVVRWLVAIIVPLIGMRFVDFEWLTAVLFTYKVFAIASTTAIPLVMFFFFVHSVGKQYPHVRKILWVLFLGVYLGLWATATDSVASTAYVWTFIAALLLLLFDAKIEYYLIKQQHEEAHTYWKADIIARLQEDITRLEASTLPDRQKFIDRKKDEIARLMKSRVY